MKYCVYILLCSDHSLYTGSTHNLKSRVAKHQSGKGPTYTKMRLPVKLVYFKCYATLTEARRREREIKGWRKEKKLNLARYGHPHGHQNNP
ncbi:MAG: GIY-YIG nuclease family protein [Patescibacteria group bacterium]